ncbi:MAG: helix-turn-helix transcriptional regulator [Actinomycetota bacterium]
MTNPNRVRELRGELGLSQEKLAAKADVSTGTIRAIERGHSPRLTTAQRLAQVLGVSVDDLFPEAIAS